MWRILAEDQTKEIQIENQEEARGARLNWAQETQQERQALRQEWTLCERVTVQKPQE